MPFGIMSYTFEKHALYYFNQIIDKNNGADRNKDKAFTWILLTNQAHTGILCVDKYLTRRPMVYVVGMNYIKGNHLV